MSGFTQAVRRLSNTDWTRSGVLAAATAAPTLATDGHGLDVGAEHVQFFAETMVAITDHSLRLWLYVDGYWTVMNEQLNLGALSRIYEVAGTAIDASRYEVQLVALTGTSLRLHHRCV